MSTKTTQPIENTTTAGNAPTDGKAALVANVRAEATAYSQAVSEVTANGAKLGNLTIDEIARAFGRSASVNGRPTVAAWFALVSALAGQENMSHERRTQIVRIAMAEHKSLHGANVKFKPCATQKAKAGLGKGNASYALNMPVSVSVAAE